MSRIFFIFILISTCIGYTVSESQWKSIRDCEQRYRHLELDFSEKFDEIITQKRHYGHVAAIGWSTAVNDDILWNCSGALISPDFILTTAHCASWLGTAPKFVRLGDLSLDQDTEHHLVQQFSIVDIHIHPDYNRVYQHNDVALIKLNSSVRVTERVTPICLWNENHFDFLTLVGCGYGQKDFALNPTVTEMKLDPMTNNVCGKYYENDNLLPNGFIDSQLCANKSSLESNEDECNVGSGDSLLINLLYGNHEHPFLIGSASYIPGCGAHTPVVYSRIPSYIDWITTIVSDLITNPKECASKYLKYRNFETDSYEKFNETHIKVDESKYKFGGRTSLPSGENPLKDLVKIGWNETEWTCYGTIITEKYVLTTASCVKKHRENPNVIQAKYDKLQVNYSIRRIVIHQNFNEQTAHNDIALIELENEFKFNEDVMPSCLWKESKLPNEIPNEDEANIGIYGSEKLFDKDPILQHIRVAEMNQTRYNEFYYGKLLKSQACYGNEDYYIVPEYCELLLGAPTKTLLSTNNTLSWYTMTLTSYGKNCGFGYPVVLTKVAHYLDWIDSVVFNIKSDHLSEDHLLHDNECRLPDTTKGNCLTAQECPLVLRVIEARGEQLSDYKCTTKMGTSALCCPLI